MTARGYCTPADVAAELGGAAFSPEETALCDARIAAVELLLDKELGRSWLMPSPVSGEQSRIYGSHLYLQQRPVVSVEAVRVRADIPGAVPQPATALEQYELLDAAAGLLLLGYWYCPATWVSVDYTHAGPTGPVPADVALFTAKAAAHFMGTVRSGGLGPLGALGGQLSRLAVGQGDLSLDFRDAAAGFAVPAELWTLVAGYRRVAFA